MPIDLELLGKLQSFKLGEEEEKGFQLEASDVRQSTEKCSRCHVGKIFGEKTANYSGLKSTLDLIWNSIAPMKIRELGGNMYQFVFASQEDKLRVLNGKVWTFDSQYLILKQWEKDIDLKKEGLNKVQLWVQV